VTEGGVWTAAAAHCPAAARAVGPLAALAAVQAVRFNGSPRLMLQ
jgi:hypothetical protein